jgi:hypothetical protein
MRPESPSGLYWSDKGEIACADHAPHINDPRWISHRWKVLSAVLGHHGMLYQCQHCSPSGTPILHKGN